MYQKYSGIGKIYATEKEGRGYLVSSSETFCLTGPKTSIGETFSLS